MPYSLFLTHYSLLIGINQTTLYFKPLYYTIIPPESTFSRSLLPNKDELRTPLPTNSLPNLVI
jgi:hypothetical protein